MTLKKSTTKKRMSIKSVQEWKMTIDLNDPDLHKNMGTN